MLFLKVHFVFCDIRFNLHHYSVRLKSKFAILRTSAKKWFEKRALRTRLADILVENIAINTNCLKMLNMAV